MCHLIIAQPRRAAASCSLLATTTTTFSTYLIQFSRFTSAAFYIMLRTSVMTCINSVWNQYHCPDIVAFWLCCVSIFQIRQVITNYLVLFFSCTYTSCHLLVLVLCYFFSQNQVRNWHSALATPLQDEAVTNIHIITSQPHSCLT